MIESSKNSEAWFSGSAWSCPSGTQYMPSGANSASQPSQSRRSRQSASRKRSCSIRCCRPRSAPISVRVLHVRGPGAVLVADRRLAGPDGEDLVAGRGLPAGLAVLADPVAALAVDALLAAAIDLDIVDHHRRGGRVDDVRVVDRALEERLRG